MNLPLFKRAQAHDLADRMWDFAEMAYAAMARSDEWGRKVANAAYEALKREAIALHGPNARCCDVDPDLYQHFSDCFKDEYGCRPTTNHTLADAEAFLKPFQVPA